MQMESDLVDDLISNINEYENIGLITHTITNMSKLASMVEKLGNISLFDKVSKCTGYNDYKSVLIARKTGNCYWRNTAYSLLSEEDKTKYVIDRALNKM